jgi:hypothetical protein
MRSLPLSRLPVILLSSSSVTHSCVKAGRVLTLILAALLAGPVMSAPAEKLDLATLRARLELDLAQSTLPALRQYAGELGSLEKQAAAARDYDTAGAVRAERLRVTAEAASQEKLALLLETSRGWIPSPRPKKSS